MESNKNVELPVCGIVRPISCEEPYAQNHWDDVQSIIEKCMASKYEVKLVSKGSFVIHNEIVRNLYHNQMVICDISSHNPNVMFELGMRLAFNKPFVIICDDNTDFPFDTGNIFTIKYPKDLNYKDIVNFQSELVDKVEQMQRLAGSKDFAILKEFAGLDFVDFSKLEKNTDKVTELFSLVSNKLDMISSNLDRRLSVQGYRAMIDPLPVLENKIKECMVANHMFYDMVKAKDISDSMAFLDKTTDLISRNGPGRVERALARISENL